MRKSLKIHYFLKKKNAKKNRISKSKSLKYRLKFNNKIEMALYKELHRPRNSLNFDSPNAEMNFLKSMTSKLSKDSPKLDFQFEFL